MIPSTFYEISRDPDDFTELDDSIRYEKLEGLIDSARTALVELSPGWIIPYFFATSMVISSIKGNFTSTFFILLYSIFSLIVRNQAMWL